MKNATFATIAMLAVCCFTSCKPINSILRIPGSVANSVLGPIRMTDAPDQPLTIDNQAIQQEVQTPVDSSEPPVIEE